MNNLKFKQLLALLFVIIITIPGFRMEGDDYLAFCEQIPSPIGGIEGIYKIIKYPKTAINSGIEGKVYVLAFINEDGNVDDVKVVKGIGSGCDEEVIKAVKASKFYPGSAEGKNVKIKMSLQIQFKLD